MFGNPGPRYLFRIAVASSSAYLGPRRSSTPSPATPRGVIAGVAAASVAVGSTGVARNRTWAAARGAAAARGVATSLVRRAARNMAAPYTGHWGVVVSRVSSKTSSMPSNGGYLTRNLDVRREKWTEAISLRPSHAVSSWRDLLLRIRVRDTPASSAALFEVAARGRCMRSDTRIEDAPGRVYDMSILLTVSGFLAPVDEPSMTIHVLGPVDAEISRPRRAGRST